MAERNRHGIARIAVIGLMTMAAVSAARAEGDAACARDVLVANSMQRQAGEQLESAGDDQASQCRVWRRHIDTMRRIAGVYGRCLSGPDRKEKLAQTQGQEIEFSGLVRNQCKGL
ncbi:hypothetical protein GGR33_000265 [Methylobacterium brachythecii]|uniref:UrcA family protein n=1 Tax=Methylobacterium brachythecii TaxID=1176177 RepID=A0A7W6F4V6_9HYPH|nr:hypothetical protein [Methylobacterium brachythecii]